MATSQSNCNVPKAPSSSLSVLCTLLPPEHSLQYSSPTDGIAEQSSAVEETAGASLSYLARHQPAWQCSFHSTGKYLAVAMGAPCCSIRIFIDVHHTGTGAPAPESSMNKGRRQSPCHFVLQAELKGVHTRTVRSVAFAPTLNPITFAAASFDGTVSLWEQQIQRPKTQQEQVANSSKDENGIRNDDLWDCVAQLEGHDNEVKCVTWNASGSLLATCGRDKTVWLWECALVGSVSSSDGETDVECLTVLSGHDSDVKAVVFASSHNAWGDGDEILFSCGYDNTIRLWAEDAGEWYCASVLDTTVHANTIWTICCSPSATRIISGSADGCLAIYKYYSSIEEWEKVNSSLKENNDTETNSRNRKKIARQQQSSSDKGVWKCVGRLPDAHAGHAVYSVDCASSRCGHGRIASGGGDNGVNVYREEHGVASDRPSFALDCCTSDESVDVQIGGDVNHVCWHPWDGSILAVACDDGSVRLLHYDIH